MPIYDYKCRQCGHEMKDQLKKYEETVIQCNSCGLYESNRQFSGRFSAHGLQNGFIGNPRRTNIHDKRIDPSIFKSKNAEKF